MKQAISREKDLIEADLNKLYDLEQQYNKQLNRGANLDDQSGRTENEGKVSDAKLDQSLQSNTLLNTSKGPEKPKKDEGPKKPAAGKPAKPAGNQGGSGARRPVTSNKPGSKGAGKDSNKGTGKTDVKKPTSPAKPAGNPQQAAAKPAEVPKQEVKK